MPWPKAGPALPSACSGGAGAGRTSVDAQGARGTPVPRAFAQAHALGTSSLANPPGRPGGPTDWAVLWAEALGGRAHVGGGGGGAQLR